MRPLEGAGITDLHFSFVGVQIAFIFPSCHISPAHPMSPHIFSTFFKSFLFVSTCCCCLNRLNRVYTDSCCIAICLHLAIQYIVLLYTQYIEYGLHLVHRKGRTLKNLKVKEFSVFKIKLFWNTCHIKQGPSFHCHLGYLCSLCPLTELITMSQMVGF